VKREADGSPDVQSAQVHEIQQVKGNHQSSRIAGKDREAFSAFLCPFHGFHSSYKPHPILQIKNPEEITATPIRAL
jgi:hypothetical protein